MREKDELAEALVAIQKKAKLAVMKDRVGENEISDSPLTSNDRFVTLIYLSAQSTTTSSLMD